MSAAITELDALLRSLRPVRQPGTFAFCQLPAGWPVPEAAVSWFREPPAPASPRPGASSGASLGGTTVILPSDAARAAGLPVEFDAAWLTLTVHSSLAAVGLTAAVAAALTAAGVSCNVVAAYYHDHLFVPAERADEALAALDRLAAGAPAA